MRHRSHRYIEDRLCGFLLWHSYRRLMKNFKFHVIFKKGERRVWKSYSDMSGKAVQGFTSTEDQIFLSPSPFLNMGLETVTVDFQRQARITIISGSFLIIVLIQMNLFHDAKNHWEQTYPHVSQCCDYRWAPEGNRGCLKRNQVAASEAAKGLCGSHFGAHFLSGCIATSAG